MQIDPATTEPRYSYKLLTNLVIPRPIAWVSSLNAQGNVNLAPFSFFNAVSGHPPYVIVSVDMAGDRAIKDTASNAMRNGEFVVNLVTEELIDAMNISAANFPAGVSELDAAGLTAAPSSKIKTPRVAQSQANLECKLHNTMALGENTLLIGEIVMFHVADHLLGPRFQIDGFNPIGRLGSPSLYSRTTDRFNLPRINYAQWLERTQ